MNHKRRGTLFFVIVILLGTMLISGCCPNSNKGSYNDVRDTPSQSSAANSDSSGADFTTTTSEDTISNEDAIKQYENSISQEEAALFQDEAVLFTKIEPAILKTTQNVTYSLSDVKLTFSFGTDTADFPEKDVSSIFKPKVYFLPDSIFVSLNKIAVVRMPDDDSIVITYSDDNGKSWIDSDEIHKEHIPDHATDEATFLDKNTPILSLYVAFPTKETGFLIIGSETLMNTQHTRALYKTIDGGKTWKYLDSNITGQGFPVTGMNFTDENSGFIVQSSIVSPEVDILQTKNGGVDWSKYVLPTQSELPGELASQLTSFSPYYVSDKWYLPIFEEPDRLIYFTSKDQGATWSHDNTMSVETMMTQGYPY